MKTLTQDGARIRELNALGYSDPEIARDIGKSSSFVWKQRLDMGLKPAGSVPCGGENAPFRPDNPMTDEEIAATYEKAGRGY